MDRTKTFGVITLLLLLTGCGRPADQIVVASKNFTEQVILGEIISQHLEHRLGKKVVRRLNLGGTLIAHQALVTGEIDLYPEYTGTGAAAILKQDAPKSSAELLRQVRESYRTRFGIEWLDPLGFNNTFAMVVRGDRARASNLRRISDAAREAGGWTLGVGYEFESRQDGLRALDQTYGLHWTARPKTMDLGLLFRALTDSQVSMIAANSTDGLLSKEDFVTLEDDRSAFPAYEACILVRHELRSKKPQFIGVLAELSGKLDSRTMQKLNFLVDVEHRPIGDVAAEFLRTLASR